MFVCVACFLGGRRKGGGGGDEGSPKFVADNLLSNFVIALTLKVSAKIHLPKLFAAYIYLLNNKLYRGKQCGPRSALFVEEASKTFQQTTFVVFGALRVKQPIAITCELSFLQAA